MTTTAAILTQVAIVVLAVVLGWLMAMVLERRDRLRRKDN
jgi:hypothetical protein